MYLYYCCFERGIAGIEIEYSDKQADSGKERYLSIIYSGLIAFAEPEIGTFNGNLSHLWLE